MCSHVYVRSLKQLSVKPLEANAQLWEMGPLPWLQIFVTIGILEVRACIVMPCGSHSHT